MACLPAPEAVPVGALLPSAGNACLVLAFPDCLPSLADEPIKDQFRIQGAGRGEEESLLLLAVGSMGSRASPHPLDPG